MNVDWVLILENTLVWSDVGFAACFGILHRASPAEKQQPRGAIVSPLKTQQPTSTSYLISAEPNPIHHLYPCYHEAGINISVVDAVVFRFEGIPRARCWESAYGDIWLHSVQ
jgi:hypothetical protein